jgi:IS30 family transposase
MARRRRRLSRDEQQELWTRWRGEESLESIGNALRVSTSGVWGVVRRSGGIAPVPPTRRATALTLLEREVIQRGVAAADSCHAIGRTLGRAPSTISREIARYGERTAQRRGYCARTADERAWRAARRPKAGRLATCAPLCAAVATKLALEWSPAQIAGWLVRTYPEDLTMRVSAETIYRSLYVQARGVLRKELATHLRQGHRLRRPQARAGPGGRSHIVGAISISARPPEVAARAVPGHWEGDLLAGSANSYIATLVERASRFVVLVKVTGKDSPTVVRALIRGVKRLPQGLMTSLTWDRGTELAQHRAFTIATDVAVYFCDPQSPWQRGTNENTNGLLRQYFPKGTDLSPYTQRQLDAVARRLNMRPRQTLGFQTPAENFAAYVASTG